MCLLHIPRLLPRLLNVGFVKMRIAVKARVHARLKQRLSVTVHFLNKHYTLIIYILVYCVAGILFKYSAQIMLIGKKMMRKLVKAYFFGKAGIYVHYNIPYAPAFCITSVG